MKSTFILILFALIHLNIFGQSKKWNYYDIDSIVSIKMPQIVYEFDSITNFGSIYQVYTIDSIENFRVQKTEINNYLISENLKLPTTKKSLKILYREIGWTINEFEDYSIDRYFPIEKSNLIGYRLIYKNDKLDIMEIQFFLINKFLYIFNYSNINGLKEENKALFFDSIEFDQKHGITQFPKKSILSLKNIILLFIILLLISYFIRIKNKVKS